MAASSSSAKGKARGLSYPAVQLRNAKCRGQASWFLSWFSFGYFQLFDDFEPRHFSADEIPERDRLARWREEFGRTIVNVDLQPVDPDQPLKAQAVLRGLPGLGVVSCSGSPTRFVRTARQAADGDDCVGFIINPAGSALASQLGVEAELHRGDAIPVRTGEAGALTCSAQLALVLPRLPIASRVDNLDDTLMRVVRRENGALKLLIGYLDLILNDATLLDQELRGSIVGHIYDLVAMAIGSHRDATKNAKHTVATVRLAAVNDYIRRNFTDPALTVESVARRHKISPRYLQQLLEKSGVSLVSRVNELRLNRALALLVKFPHLPIAEISVQAGFSSVSHFNRLFRARFGDTPSGMRGNP